MSCAALERQKTPTRSIGARHADMFGKERHVNSLRDGESSGYFQSTFSAEDAAVTFTW